MEETENFQPISWSPDEINRVTRAIADSYADHGGSEKDVTFVPDAARAVLTALGPSVWLRWAIALEGARGRMLNASKTECSPAFYREMLDLLPAAQTLTP